MENALWLIPVLACPLMMVVMMWAMGKGMGMSARRKDDRAQEGSVDDLRAEQERLAEQIDRLESRGAEHEDREPAARGA
jgi:hypothetical protein